MNPIWGGKKKPEVRPERTDRLGMSRPPKSDSPRPTLGRLRFQKDVGALQVCSSESRASQEEASLTGVATATTGKQSGSRSQVISPKSRGLYALSDSSPHSCICLNAWSPVDELCAKG